MGRAETCMISHLPIQDGSNVMCFVMVENKVHSGIVYTDSRFTPVLPVFECIYSEGEFEPVDVDLYNYTCDMLKYWTTNGVLNLKDVKYFYSDDYSENEKMFLHLQCGDFTMNCYELKSIDPYEEGSRVSRLTLAFVLKDVYTSMVDTIGDVSTAGTFIKTSEYPTFKDFSIQKGMQFSLMYASMSVGELERNFDFKDDEPNFSTLTGRVNYFISNNLKILRDLLLTDLYPYFDSKIDKNVTEVDSLAKLEVVRDLARKLSAMILFDIAMEHGNYFYTECFVGASDYISDKIQKSIAGVVNNWKEVEYE